MPVDPVWLESDEEFEGVGAHPENPRYDHDAAQRDHEAALADPWVPDK